MQITFQYEKAMRVSSELLALSRRVRQIGSEIDDVIGQLRTESAFEAIRMQLRGQEEKLFTLTAHLVRLSAALNEIVELYDRAETRNGERLEGGSGWYSPPQNGQIHQSGEITVRLERILYP